jgi:hypothetical protein
MAWYGKDDDSFGSNEVEKARQERHRNEGEAREFGGWACSCCGRVNSHENISMCYYCHKYRPS